MGVEASLVSQRHFPIETNCRGTPFSQLSPGPDPRIYRRFPMPIYAVTSSRVIPSAEASVERGTDPGKSRLSVGAGGSRGAEARGDSPGENCTNSSLEEPEVEVPLAGAPS